MALSNLPRPAGKRGNGNPVKRQIDRPTDGDGEGAGKVVLAEIPRLAPLAGTMVVLEGVWVNGSAHRSRGQTRREGRRPPHVTERLVLTAFDKLRPIAFAIYTLSGQSRLERDPSVSRDGEFPRLAPARGEAGRAVIAQFCVARSGAPLLPVVKAGDSGIISAALP
jgi:hypothetical protein